MVLASKKLWNLKEGQSLEIGGNIDDCVCLLVQQVSVFLIGEPLWLLPLSVGGGQAPSYVHHLDLTRTPCLNILDEIEQNPCP